MSVDYDFGSYFGGDVATEIDENVLLPRWNLGKQTSNFLSKNKL